MSVELNHTIVHSRDKHASAAFLSEILGLGAPGSFGHFVTVATANGVSLDYDDSANIRPQHYAFVVDDEDFDPIFERVKERSIPYFAYPGHGNPGEINTRRGGRGFYFDDPDGHSLEVLTRASIGQATPG